MAIDIHTVPGKFFSFIFFSLCSWTQICSAIAVEVEHSFSHERILIGHLCNRLRVPSIRALMCFGDWCRLCKGSPLQ